MWQSVHINEVHFHIESNRIWLDIITEPQTTVQPAWGGDVEWDRAKSLTQKSTFVPGA